MPMKKKQQIKVNNTTALEGLMQEVYNDACGQINDANRTINELQSSTTPEDVEDATKIAKTKIDAQKVKDSSIKIKLDLAKLQSDIIKHSGNASEAINEKSGGKVSMSDFKAVRKMMEENAKANEIDETDE